jgi:hypothetical protein
MDEPIEQRTVWLAAKHTNAGLRAINVGPSPVDAMLILKYLVTEQWSALAYDQQVWQQKQTKVVA